MLETTYENEHDATSADIRYFMWGAALSGSGVIFGTSPIWRFTPDWRDHLDSPSVADMEVLSAVLDQMPWYALVPSGLDGVPDPIAKGHGKYTAIGNVGDGAEGGMDWVVPAMTRDRRQFIAYVPDGHKGSFTLDMSAFAGPTHVRWIDPTNGAMTDAGVYENSGNLKLSVPSKNAQGAEDWVLAATTV